MKQNTKEFIWMTGVPIIVIIIGVFLKRYTIMDYRDIILYFFTPLTAFSVFLFSLWTFQQNRKSKRSFFAPSDEDHIFGSIDNTEFIQTGSKGKINLINHGSNPASRIDIDILTYNKSDIDGENVIPSPFRKYQTYGFNPIPHGGQFKSKFKGNVIEGMGANYLILRMRYFDTILKKNYTQIFLWLIGDEEILEEVSPNEANKLIEFLNINDKLFWERVKKSKKN